MLEGRGTPVDDVEQLADAGEGEEREEDAERVADAEHLAEDAVEAEEEGEDEDGPGDVDEGEVVLDGEREEALGAADEVGRDRDAEHDAHDGEEAPLLQRIDDGEDQQAEEEDVGDLCEAGGAEGEGDVHADIGAAAEEVAEVHDEDERAEADALAEELDPVVTAAWRGRRANGDDRARLNGNGGRRHGQAIFSKRSRMRPLSRGWRVRVRKRPSQAARRSVSESEP